MLLKHNVLELVGMDATTLSRITRNSGYKDAKFDTCEFVGITNSGDFCYKVSYIDDGAQDFTKVYVWHDKAGNYVADY